jgi:hypothetical protein
MQAKDRAMRRFDLVGAGLVLLCSATQSFAGGLLPDRDNKVLIEGQFSNPEQEFLLVFSAKPLRDGRGRTLSSISERELKAPVSSRDQVIVKVSGKRQSKSGQFEFFFGPSEDKDRPWNDGREFAWEKWSDAASDVWDNLGIVAPVTGKNDVAVITNVAIVRGDKVLYDSRKRESYPNKSRVQASFPKFNATPRAGQYPVLDLGSHMARFRREYYELGDNPFLASAYADLGQTEKSKYANRGKNWCSEFASWVYRENGVLTPDPNRSDVHFRSMREFFEQQGRVYSMREVANWSDKEKLARIKPGSFVSILLGDSTHSLIFTTWVRSDKGPITSYTAISGNNKGMVWAHSPLKLPSLESLKGKTAAELVDFDGKVYFAVPGDGKGP